MSSNIESELEFPNETLTLVRQSVTEVYNQCPESFDEGDYKRLMKDDLWIKRFMRRRRGEVAGSTQLIKAALEWRKRNEVSKMRDSSFPLEFHELGGIYPFKEDKEGNSVLHVRTQLFQKVPPILDLIKKYTIFQMIKADEISAAKGKCWVLLLDCSQTGVINADLEMANFLITTIRNYFPYGQQYILVHNLPWILKAIQNVVTAVLPAHVKRRIKSSNNETLANYVPVKNLPSYLGGDSSIAYRVIPEGLMTTEEMVRDGRLSITNEELEKVLKYYEKVRDILRKS